MRKRPEGANLGYLAIFFNEISECLVRNLWSGWKYVSIFTPYGEYDTRIFRYQESHCSY